MKQNLSSSDCKQMFAISKVLFYEKKHTLILVYESIQVIFHFFFGRVIRKLSIWLKKIIKGIKRLDNVQKFLS